MTRADVQAWLDGYAAAWRSYDRASIESLFTEDAEYRYHPYDEPLVGASAIADSWLSSQDAPGGWSASYQPHLVEDNKATATGTTTYQDGRIFWNMWELEFTPDGRCRRFVEWFMRQP
ncbi:MAG TPA: nuclear transport factor 2 family protein [Acidimicrobiia bacterium]|nr:nuclear transport factor 2 family protein [Acidimicrobiia bacterium]